MTRFIKYLNEKEKEHKTTQTEDLHEIFFALAILGQISNGTSIKSFTSLQEILDFISKNKKKLGKVDETKSTLKNYIEGELDSKQIKLLKDADTAGKTAIEKIKAGYNIEDDKIVSVERVFGVGESGKKIIADDKVNIKIKSGSDTVLVSLKYGEGQFNNLSIPYTIKKLYGIDIKGILSDIYNKTEYGKMAIDNALKYYISEINKQFSEKIENKIKIKNSITYKDFKNIKKDIRIVYRKLYTDLNNKSKKEYGKKKKEIHKAIGAFLDDVKSPIPTQENYVELLTFLLRAEPDTSYLYVAKGGKKVFFMPSQDALKRHEYTIDLKKTKETATGYKRDIDILVNGELVIGVDLNFRWSQGQFMGEYSQKGSRIVVNQNFKW